MTKRMGLFIFFDKDNIVDDYVIYLLEEISKVIDGMVIISNSKLSLDEKNKLDKYCFKYIERENKGFDAGALCEYFRNNTDYKNYDEIVYFNDTYYAPLYPFKNIFDEMDTKNCDFWGLTLGETEKDGYNVFEDHIIPKHLQTFFIVFRKKVFMSDIFLNYWKDYDLENMTTFVDVVSKHELSFTKFLAENGFKYDYYVKSKLVSNNHLKNFNHFAYLASNQIINENAIYLKRKNFGFPIENMLFLNANSELKKVYNYIEKTTDYDTKLIWKNVLRLYNLYDVGQAFGLNEIIIPKNYNNYTEVSYFIIINNTYIIDILLDKIKNITGNFKFYTNLTDIYKKFNELKYDIKEYNGNLMSLILEDIKNANNNYIAFINLDDDDGIPLVVHYTKGETYLENLFYNENYIEEIINRIKNENISMAYAPNTYVRDDLKLSTMWDKITFDNVKSLVPNYKLLNITKNPISMQEAWIAKKELINNIPESLTTIEDNEFIKAFSIAMAYYGALNYKYPLIVSNLEFSNYYISLQSSIIEKSYFAIYNNNTHYNSKFLVVLNEINNQKKEYQKKLHKSQKKYEKKINKKLEEIYESKSWKLTKPLRNTKNKIKKWKKNI